MQHNNNTRKTIIQNALKEYKNAHLYHLSHIPSKEVLIAIEHMEDAYGMCVLWSVEGIEELKQTILEAKKYYEIESK